MSRNLTSGFITASASSERQFRHAFLVELAFTSGTIRAWTGSGDLTWNGQTWAGVGTLAGIGAVEESTDVSARGLQISLSAIPTEVLSLALSEHCQGRPAKVWLALFDLTTGAIIADPVQIFGGRADTISAVLSGETYEASVSCENRLIDLNTAKEARYTHEEQQRLHPGDMGCEFVAGIGDKPIYWGVASPLGTVPALPRIPRLGAPF